LQRTELPRQRPGLITESVRNKPALRDTS
jgi:hypothetical protein